MLISKKSIRRDELSCMKRKAGYRERNIMENSRWVTTASKGRYVTFTAPNMNYKKSRYETTKSFGATFDRKRCEWVN